MAYWLLKTEPEEFSWDDQLKRAPRVKSGAACAIRCAPSSADHEEGDRAFFYHTGDESRSGSLKLSASTIPIQQPARTSRGSS
jgi:predicted RNA-binding protein with PUA-like domain